MAFELSIRVNETNPSHHLWRNHKTLWMHYCLTDGGKKRRVRFSLETRDFEVACRLRDERFRKLQQLADEQRAAATQAAPKAGLLGQPVAKDVAPAVDVAPPRAAAPAPAEAPKASSRKRAAQPRKPRLAVDDQPGTHGPRPDSHRPAA
ncbi:MAG: hypothetical protein ACKOSS_08095 [Planctomycetia bacterium]